MKPASSTEYRHPREGGCNPIDRLQLVSRKPERFSEHLWCRLRKRKRAMAPKLCFWTGNSRNRTKVLRSSQSAELDYILAGGGPGTTAGASLRCPRASLATVRCRVRRETGKELMVRVHYDEGAAIHIGPESCAGGREAVREALTGECAGQPLSHEKDDIPGADAVRYAEGHTKGRAIASSPTTRRGRRPWHVQTLFVREPGGLVADQGGMPRLVRIGKARSRSR